MARMTDPNGNLSLPRSPTQTRPTPPTPSPSPPPPLRPRRRRPTSPTPASSRRVGCASRRRPSIPRDDDNPQILQWGFYTNSDIRGWFSLPWVLLLKHWGNFIILLQGGNHPPPPCRWPPAPGPASSACRAAPTSPTGVPRTTPPPGCPLTRSTGRSVGRSSNANSANTETQIKFWSGESCIEMSPSSPTFPPGK